MGKAIFIAFEGIDGSGKSTQIERLKRRLEEEKKRVYTTMEPSPLPIGKLLRKVLTKEIKTDHKVIAPLFAADRLDHILNEEEGILRRLREGSCVLCDRYYFSSYAYQGMDLPLEWVIEVNKQASELLRPTATIFIDIDEDTAMERILKNRDTVELFEKKETLRKVREKYLEAFELLKDSETVIRIDGKKTMDEISEEIWTKVKKVMVSNG